MVTWGTQATTEKSRTSNTGRTRARTPARIRDQQQWCSTGNVSAVIVGAGLDRYYEPGPGRSVYGGVRASYRY